MQVAAVAQSRWAPYPDDDREQRPASRGQVDIGVQQVFIQVRVWQQRQFGQHSSHLQVDIIGLEDREERRLK